MENKSLVQIVHDSIDIEKLLMESEGEMTPEIEKALAITEASLTDKVDGYVHIIERFEALATHYKDRAEFFKTVSGRCATAAKVLQNNIKYAMSQMSVFELKGNDMRFKIAPTSGTVIIDDEEMIPVEFKEQVMQTKVKTKELKEALAKGEVTGARLEPGFSLRMYANVPERKKKAEVANV